MDLWQFFSNSKPNLFLALLFFFFLDRELLLDRVFDRVFLGGNFTESLSFFRLKKKVSLKLLQFSLVSIVRVLLVHQIFAVFNQVTTDVLQVHKIAIATPYKINKLQFLRSHDPSVKRRHLLSLKSVTGEYSTLMGFPA